jgi:hypothetical protein
MQTRKSEPQYDVSRTQCNHPIYELMYSLAASIGIQQTSKIEAPIHQKSHPKRRQFNFNLRNAIAIKILKTTKSRQATILSMEGVTVRSSRFYLD